jgi:hypothetical protein
MVNVASIYLRFYMEVGVGTFLPTPIPSRIPSDSDSTALDITQRRMASQCGRFGTLTPEDGTG